MTKSDSISYSIENLRVATDDELLAAECNLCQRNLKDFIFFGWSVLEPDTPYVHNWHIDVICEHLEAVNRREITKLLINVPPGMAKSLIVSVFWPVWTWLQNASERFLTASYVQTLSTRDSLRSRRLIESSWFQERWGHLFHLVSDQNAKTRYENDKTGFRLATSVGGATGERGTIRILDDPHNMLTVQSDLIRESDLEWIRTVWPSRKAGVDPVEVVIMQRLHEEDAAGHYLAMGDWEHLMLPMRYETDRTCFTVQGKIDQREDEGELLFRALYSETDVAKLERELGSYGTAGQLQQRPAPASGGIFKRHWWRFWKPKGVDLPPITFKLDDGSIYHPPVEDLPPLDRQAQSWDMTFKDTKASSYVVGQVWGQARANKYLLDQRRDKLDLPATLSAVRDITAQYPQATMKLVEDKANGPAVIQVLRTEIAGLIAVNPQGDKVARAHAVAPEIESGNVYLPHPALFPWVDNLINNLTGFPNMRYKDEVDALTQALMRMLGGGQNIPPDDDMVEEKGRWNATGDRARGSRWRR